MILFDKQLKVELTTDSGATAVIDTPLTGRKPSMTIQGRLLPSAVVTNFSLRIVNFFSYVPLDSYKFITIYAGYKNDLEVVCTGEIMFSYQETPGPDGVTVFEILLGFTDKVYKADVNISKAPGTLLSDVLKDVATELGVTLINYTPKTTKIPTSFNCTQKAINSVDKLREMFPNLVLRLDGNRLIAYVEGIGTGVVHTIPYIKSARKDASGYNVIAPWIPSIRPGDVVDIDLKFFRQSYGGAQVAFGRLFSVLTIDFLFSTVESANEMKLLLLGVPVENMDEATSTLKPATNPASLGG